MGRLLFVTVGTTSIYAKDLSNIDDYELKTHVTELRDALKGDRARLVEQRGLLARLVTAHELVWEEICRTTMNPTIAAVMQGPHRTSAEMTSTWLLMVASAEGLHGLFEAGKDRIVLLSSDTIEGVLASCVNAALMHRFLFPLPCNCGFDFQQCWRPLAGVNGPRRAGCNSVQIEVIDKMEAGTGFASTSAQLKQILDRLMRARPEACFNITGGYKGVIPSITYLVSTQYHAAPIYYLHESMDEAVRIRFTPVGHGATPDMEEIPLEFG